ncbi:MAG: histidine triad nucleotide-binding protein [Leptospirales bacterium]
MNDLSCVFCRIVKGEIPSQKLSEDQTIIAIRDLNPQSPQHVLVIPKEHDRDLSEALHREGGEERVGKIFKAAVRIAREQGLDAGFRLVVNTGSDGGQTVGHLHIHLMGGRQMTWPPG